MILFRAFGRTSENVFQEWDSIEASCKRSRDINASITVSTTNGSLLHEKSHYLNIYLHVDL
jgi:hypothetical protein